MGRFIIIGTAGIGGALARKLKAQGHEPFLIGRNAGQLSELGSELTCEHAVADVTDMDALMVAVHSAGTILDGLAYCVGTINLKPVTRFTEADVSRDFEVNALGAFRAVQSALPALKASTQDTASILLFSTVAVGQGFASHVSVAMAKGAVEGMTRALAAELAPKIRVNAIAPSLTQTPLAESLTRNAATAQALAALHPLQRLGTSEDMASLGAFLLGPEASWITGQIIGVDGGRGTLRTKG
ncbi:SDR family NAD(P)-dependent oxidoreductase [Aestuariivirga litoralis]|uniref:SDR family NAD(P)-dependent oxidoreductase n=1 Tax=Aestuariivirga litoralis TaxID=2650924 RepID=UPI0018C69DB1|nr:SDR family oxidoreductase [Aestuariivirga litoralis]MBG1231312.1 SDR family oxidoreductase [Aestuariivirga litoralis]